MFELDFRNIIVLVSLCIHASLLWILYRYGRKTAGGRAYTAAILAIAGWILPMVVYRAHLFDETLLWARVLYIMATFTSVTFFYFTLVFPNKKRSKSIPLVLLIETIAIILLLVHPTYIIQDVVFVEAGEDIIKFGPLYPLFSSHISLFFLAGFIVLFRNIRKTHGVERKQMLNILVGYFLASNLAMTTNLILPWFGYFELNWLGQFFSTLVAVFTTYAILKNKLMNIRLIATEWFIILLNLFLAVRFVLSNSAQDVFVNGSIFIGVICISYLLLESIKEEVKRREEMTQLAKSLEKANTRLQELDRQKTEFLSIASHQLRTPLSIIKGYLELINDGAYGKPSKELKAILSNMDESNERLVSLVDEFLNISRIEQGRTKYAFADADINAVISSVVQELQGRAEGKGLSIEWSQKNSFRHVYMDEEKIRHIVFNYIDNAIKYSDKGKIRVRLQKQDGGVSVRVKDNGFGFDKEDEANFFNKFYRGKNVEGTNVNGTGLGIYVCKQFAEAHGGNVWATSNGLGKGSEFGFWIPVKKTRAHELSSLENEPKQTIVNQYSIEKESVHK